MNYFVTSVGVWFSAVSNRTGVGEKRTGTGKKFFLRILPKTALKNPIYGGTIILRPMTSPTAIVRSSVALLPNKSDNFRMVKMLLLEMVLK